jgi:hypothetical protein
MSTSKFETEEDRMQRYMWNEDDNVELVERGTGKEFDVSEMLGGHARAKDEDDGGVCHSMHGLDIVIETVKGHVRGGWDEERGEEWEQIMPYDYGYLQGVQGADGDSMDVILGPNPRSSWVYVVDQRQLPPGKGFDEHKVMLGYDSQKEALSAYRRGHHRAKDVLMDWTPMHVNDFKHWLKTANLTEPCSAG